jgi:hypothetical protein
MVVRSTQQHGPGDRTCGRDVEVGIAHALLRQVVQYRGVDLASVTAQVRVTQVIGHDKKKIGPVVLLPGLKQILCI